MTISVPYSPPSANRYWRTFASGKRVITYVSEEAKHFKLDMWRFARSAKVKLSDKPIEIHITWHRKTAKSAGDLDNRLKVVIDSLNGIAYLDDKQIVRIIAEKSVSGRDGMDITINEV